MLFLDEFILFRNNLLVMLGICLPTFILLLLIIIQVALADRHNLNVVFADLLLREHGLGADVRDILGVLNVQHIVIFINELLRLERSEFEVSKQLRVVLIFSHTQVDVSITRISQWCIFIHRRRRSA